ncbi:MAG: hypothetical protein WD037_10930 [Balneolales bacterium]
MLDQSFCDLNRLPRKTLGGKSILQLCYVAGIRMEVQVSQQMFYVL